MNSNRRVLTPSSSIISLRTHISFLAFCATSFWGIGEIDGHVVYRIFFISYCKDGVEKLHPPAELLCSIIDSYYVSLLE
jgi:hypothetical protein